METKKQNDFVPINTWRLLNSFKKKQKITDKIVKSIPHKSIINEKTI